MHKVKQTAGWFSRTRVILFVLIFSLLLLGSVIYRFVAQNIWLENEFKAQIQNTQLNEEIAELNLCINNAESAGRGYAISGKPEFVKNFDASIDTIRAIYRQIQQFENRITDHADAALFLRSGSLIQQKIAFMKQVKSLCDNHQFIIAADLIATNKGLHLTDSIAVINKQISDNIHLRQQKSQANFLKVKSKNNAIAYTGISISLMLIVLFFYFLLKKIKKIKKLIRELSIQKENYRTTLNSLGEAMISTDKEGNIQYMNPVAEKLTGWQWKEAKKQPLHHVFNVVNEETGQPFEHIVSRILKTGQTIGLENNTLLRSKDSRTFIISNNGSPIFDINGDISGAVLIFNDITEKYRTAKSLQQSETHLRSIFENSSSGLLMIDKDFKIVEFNSLMLEYTRITLGRPYYKNENILEVLPQDRGEKLENNFRNILNGETVSYESTHSVEGNTIIFQVKMNPVTDPEGKVVGACISAENITERKKAEQAIKESEQKYRSLIQNLPEAIYTCDAAGYIQLYNKAAVKLWGREPVAGRDPWCGSWKIFNVDGTELPLESCPMAVCLKEGMPVHGKEIIVQRPDESYRYVLPYPSPLFNAEGQLTGAINMLLDVTDKKEREILIQRTEEKYRNLIEQASDAILIYSVDGTIYEFNKTCYNILGYTKEEYAKLRLTDILVDNIIVSQDNYAAILAGETKTLNRKLMQKDGSLLETEVSVKMLTDGKMIAFARDITERKKAEEILEESEKELRTMAESMPQIVWTTRADGWTTYFNQQWVNYTGLTLEESYGHGWNKPFHPEDQQAAWDAWQNAVTNLTEYALECRLRRHDGTYHWWLIRGVPQIDKNGEILKWYGTCTDIEKIKQSEESIKKEKELSDTIINSLPGVFYFFDENLEMIRWNKQFENITGYTAAEIRFKKLLEFFQGQDKPYMQERIRKNFASGSGDAEASITSKTGKKTPFYFTGLRMLYENRPCFLGIGIDIAERKDAERKIKAAVERYDILADATSDTIWDWDIVDNTMLYNDGISKMFGYDVSKVQNIVEWWNEKLHPDDIKTVQDSLEDVFEKKKQRFQLTYRFRCADGSYKHIFDRAFVIFDESGTPTRIIGAMQDITYQSEEEIRIAKAMIDAQEAERNLLGAELHDNIIQILAGTLLTLGMTKSEEVKTTQRTGFISSAMGYITEAINETRKLSHSLAPVGFEDNSLKDLFENLLFNINLENLFTIRLDFDDLKETVVPENIQVNLYRILQEQSKNILKYAEASTIEIAFKIIDKAVMLRIYDNGKGFDTKAKKTGIGLNNIKKRAESLGGKFVLNSAPGMGCEIIVEIPLDK